MNPYQPLSIDNAPFNSLGHLGFQRFLPHPHLRPWVQCYWIVQRNLMPGENLSETLYPDGGTTLTMDFAKGELPDTRFNAAKISSKLLFSGAIHRLGIRFHPGGAFQLLSVEMSALDQDEYSADSLRLSRIQQLQYQLAETHSIYERLLLIDHWLLELADNAKATKGLVQQLLPKLMCAQEPIAELSADLPVSQRQLERKFKLEVGFSPAKVKQLNRVKLARALISQHLDQPLITIGIDAGFYDQAHFIHQFQKITGLTPNQYRAKKMSQKYNENLG